MSDVAPAAFPTARRWRDLSPLLDQLLGLDPRRRGARLARLRRSDATLAAELETLLHAASSARASRFLSGSADAAEPEDLAGQSVGPYRVEAKLGSGGTGSVWRARSGARHGGRPVALKLCHASLGAAAGATQLRREAAILGQLAHADIAALLGSGRTGAGRPYLVVEHVDGVPIDRHCDRARLDVPGRLALVCALATALASVHARGFAHCDVKPGNVLVTATGQVRLLDFGIARAIGDRGGAAGDGDARSLRSFTPSFAAPEQQRGEAVSAATDVYALGILAYRLVAGRHPLLASGAGAATATRSGSGHDDVVPLSQAWGTSRDDRLAFARVARERGASIAVLRAQLASALGNVIAKAIAPLPPHRHGSMAELALDMRRVRTDLVVARAGAPMSDPGSSRPRCMPSPH